jgi:radical SAM protein with 4Fe4S-binding SPASM domain
MKGSRQKAVGLRSGAWHLLHVLKLRRVSESLGLEIGTLGIDIVRGCQLRCVGCPTATLQAKVKCMQKAVFRRCLENIDVRHVRKVRLFNYGEPLLHPDVAGLIRLIGEQAWSAARVEISTNAQYHDFDMLADVFRTGVLDCLVVSCDGDGTPGDYERLRPPAKWDKLLTFLATARQLRDACSPHTVLKTRTICQTEEHRRRWEEILSPLGWRPRFRSWLPLPEAPLNLSGTSPHGTNRVCPSMRKTNLYVDYDGSVVPCCWHPSAFVLGHLTRSRYSEIRKGERRANFVQTLGTDRSRLPVCAKCAR